MELPRLLVVCGLLLYQEINAQSILANNALSALIKSSLLSQNQQTSSSPIILNNNMLNSPQIRTAQAQPQNSQTYTFPLQLMQANVQPSEVSLNPLIPFGNGNILAASQSNSLLQPGVASALQSLLTNSLIAQSSLEQGKNPHTISCSNMLPSISEKAAAPSYRQRSFYSDPSGSGIQAQSLYPTQTSMSPQPQPISSPTYQSHFLSQAPCPPSEPRNEESKVTGLKSILPLLLNLMRDNNDGCGCNRCNCCCCRCGCDCRTQDVAYNNDNNDNLAKNTPSLQEMLGLSPSVTKDQYKTEQNIDNRKTRKVQSNEIEKNNENGTAVDSVNNGNMEE